MAPLPAPSGSTDEAALKELAETLRGRAERLEALDHMVLSLKQETERQRGLSDSLSRCLELVQNLVDERDAFFNLSLDMLCIATTDGYFHKVNRAFERALGYSQDELLARLFYDLLHPDDMERTRQEVAKLASGVDTITFENRYLHKDGSYHWLNWTTPAPLPGSRFLYAVARDVTEQRLREERTLYLASHDALTGLLNRWRFNEELQAGCARLKRHAHSQFAVLLLDLDQFKPINDQYGHQAGDTVLSVIAARLNAIRRESDVLGRLGGDEFALLALDADAGTARDIALRMREQIVRPIRAGDVEVAVDVSIGFALASCGADATAILELADQAMYRAKRAKDGTPRIVGQAGFDGDA